MALTKGNYGQVQTPRVYVDYVQYARAIGYLKDTWTNSLDDPEPGASWDFNPVNQHTYTTNNVDATWSNSGNHLGFIARFKNYSVSGYSNRVWGHFLQGMNYYGALGHDWGTAANGKCTEIEVECYGKNEAGGYEFAAVHEDNTYEIVGGYNNVGNGYTLVGIEDGAWTELDNRDNWEAIKFYLKATVDPWVYGATPDQIKLGTLTAGRFMDFPVSPDFNLTIGYEHDGIKQSQSLGGGNITNINYHSPPLWGIYPPWLRAELDLDETNIRSNWYKEYDSRQTRQTGRRTWNMSFSYIDKTKMFSKWSEYTQSALYADNMWSDPDTFGSSGTTIFDSIVGFFLNFTLGGQIPFIFQPNNQVQEFAICILDQKAVKIKQAAHGVYEISLKFKEVW